MTLQQAFLNVCAVVPAVDSQELQMYFDRFDICQAYYLFLSAYHEGQWSIKYARLSKMLRYFKPGVMLSKKSLSENGRAIYYKLVKQEYFNSKRVQQ